jgi:hypothetical protein
VAQPGEGSTPEEGEAPRSGSESRDPKPPAPDSSDRAKRTGSGNCADGGQPFQADVRLESLTYNKATSADPFSRGSSPAAVSKREKRRSRREKERRAVERMVEDKLKAGDCSLMDILASAMALPLSGYRSP